MRTRHKSEIIVGLCQYGDLAQVQSRLRETKMKNFSVSIAIFFACICSASTVFAQATVHRAFRALSEKEVRSEFGKFEELGKKCAQVEAKGQKCAPVTFSPEQPLNIPLHTTRGDEFLTFRASILAPRSQVRSLGYGFGKVARSRTPADRKDILDRLISRMQDAPNTIAVVLKLVARSDWSTSLPPLSFGLLNENQGKVWSSSKPNLECAPMDLLCQAGLSDTGESVTFPLFTSPNNVPFLNDTMNRVTMIVTVDGKEEPIVFDLNGLL